MSIASYAMNNKQVIHFILVLSLVGGLLAFPKLGKLEDAPFVIKDAVLTTKLPGASAMEVEELLTDPIEEVIQATRGVDYIKSESRPGVSSIKVSMKQDISQTEFNQIWDELRRKVLDVEKKLPPGASKIDVNDDFGDVYGIYYAVTADEGYEDRELEQYAKFVKRELVPLQQAAKVSMYGVQPQVVNISFSQERLANAGVTPTQITQALGEQNKLVQGGAFTTQENQIRVEAAGSFQSIDEIKELILSGLNGKMYRLGDLATIEQSYQDPPVVKMRMNGKRAIGIGISTVQGGNAVILGEQVTAKLEELKAQLPLGIGIEGIYFQDRVALQANKDFFKNLIISIFIVIVVILFAMGPRAGMLIGSSLLFSIIATLLVMLLMGIELHRTSLAAIIIAMGMLVDNAIVVTDNAQVAMKRGVPRIKALIDGASTPQWGLLGATFIAVISFLPLYLAPANAAEVIKPLFKVLAVSLTLSWIFALVQTTLYGSFILKEPKKIEDKDPYDKPFFNKLKGFIEKAIRFRWASIGIIVTVFFIFIFLGKFVKESFFPAINKNLFKVDLFFPQGTSIHQTEARAIEIEKWIMEQEKVQNLSVNIGSTPMRYYLASISVSARPNFVHFLVETETHEEVDDLMLLMREHIENNYPDGIPIISKFKVAPLPDAVIEICFRGPDPEVLRELSEQADKILRQEPLVEYYRNSWGEKTMVWKPRYSQQRGQIAGISREEMVQSLQRLTDGQLVGEYREGDQYMPIYLVAANKASYNYSNIGSTPIFNRFGEPVSLDQVVEGYDIEWENPVIKRYNRQRYIAAQVDPIWGIESPEVEAKLFPVLEEKMEIPEGYTMFWDGMFFYQDMTNKAIASQLPMAMILIITILVVLFNSYKKTIVILLMLPLIMIGVNLGFLVTGQSMGFFATLGLLGLIGMVTKNAIVLIDQINIEINQNGRAPYDAVVTAAVSRAVPVGMAAATTILGMTPLLPDPMFGGMAATIMGGLLVATILTIIVLPVFYSTIYRLKKDKK